MAISPFRPTFDPFTRMFDMMMSPLGGHAAADMIRAPETDVVETEDGIDVTMEMAGLRRDDIQIEVENNVLTVTAEKREERNEGEESGTYHLAERRFGRFSRSFVLPREVDQDHIQAHLEDGVLRIHIPKSERAKRRRIEVGAGEPGSSQGREVDIQSGGQAKQAAQGEQQGQNE